MNTSFFISCGPTFSVSTPTSGVVTISLPQQITQGSTITIEAQGDGPPYSIEVGPPVTEPTTTSSLGPIIETMSNLENIITCAIGYPSPGQYCVFSKDHSGDSAECFNVNIVTPTQFPATTSNSATSTASASSVTSTIFTSPTSSLPQSTSTSPPSVTKGDSISKGRFDVVVGLLGGVGGLCLILLLLIGRHYILKHGLFRKVRQPSDPVVHRDSMDLGPIPAASTRNLIPTHTTQSVLPNPPFGESSVTASTSAIDLNPTSSTTPIEWFTDTFKDGYSYEDVVGPLAECMNNVCQAMQRKLTHLQRLELAELNNTGKAVMYLFRILDSRKRDKKLIECFQEAVKKEETLHYLLKGYP